MHRKHQNRIAFIHAPEIYYEQSFGVRFAPIWAYTLASTLDSHWEISIHDLTVENVSRVPEAQVFAFSGINQDLHSIKRAYAHLKARYPEGVFVLGGPITWSFEKNGKLGELDCFDHLFISDGEETFNAFLRKLSSGNVEEKIIRATQRFSLQKARKLRFDLLKQKASDYYGGVLEVSRGCPFLCEFCDIRVLPQNNESHVKSIDLIIEELEEFHRLGIRQIQLACDNFIGNTAWAKECVDAIGNWMDKSGAAMALHTWVTVNLAGQPELMKKMRRAGFNSLFIGVESFNANSVLETSKLQNHNNDNALVDALKEIHSYGFIVAPGLIFGFDSDTPEMFDDTLRGVQESGLIGGDPTFLIALPGTPLHQRMKNSGRLVDSVLEKSRISKIESNIRYLQPRDFLIQGFLNFQKKYTDASYNLKRFRTHVRLMMGGDHLAYRGTLGYGNLSRFLRFQLASRKGWVLLFKRLANMLMPRNFTTILQATWLVLKNQKRYPAIKNHFLFWLFTWSNAQIKYADLKADDFKLHSINSEYDLNQMWAFLNYEPQGLKAGRDADGVKVLQQLRSTQNAVKVLKGQFEKDSKWLERFEEKRREYG